jgi:hypothetical protein
MSDDHRNDCTPEDERATDLTRQCASRIHSVEPQGEQQEDEFRREYRLQLKRQSCPGCGEDAPLF